jgi:isoamylase
MNVSDPAASGRVFISYRREETAWQASWLFDLLTKRFGSGQIFKDVDNIEVGDKWREVITRAVWSCHVLLALIGKQWLTLTDEDGLRRLDNAGDPVRLEIETALTRNVRVIPILFDGADMPRVGQLPTSLAGLVDRQALRLNASRFKDDSGPLLDVLDRTLTDVQAAKRRADEQARVDNAPPIVSVIGEHVSEHSELAAERWKLLPRGGSTLGAIYDGKGTDFSLFSSAAEGVELCLVDGDGHEERIALPDRDASTWGGYIEDVHPGQLYGYRVSGVFDPSKGLRCNQSKFLIDPYARAICGDVELWGQEVFSHDLDDESTIKINTDDSMAFMPKSVVVDPDFDWTGDVKLNIPLCESVVYEAHVKGLTILNPEVPRSIRGTFAGLAHSAMVDHYKSIGVTAIQLMPIHQFVQEGDVHDRGLTNYWGYNTIGFFAPHGPYASSGTRGQQVGEFKKMVKTLHQAGIEIILDVVFNHTAEGNHRGPTLSFRGIDNVAYYRLEPTEPFYYTDFTGTGNTLNARDAYALQLVMDSLRYWVEEMHVDGFRFDLCSALARESPDFAKGATFFSAIQQDPTLKDVKLIAEPWDAAPFGYQVGNFPGRWSELNGKFRDDVRDFWRGKGRHEVLANRLNGSPDLYKASRRSSSASINFVTSHDGFTLMDLVSYEKKRNEGNGEGNRDGTDDNRSWNCGVEGPTDDLGIQRLRIRQRKNLLTSLILSQGVPLLLAGDELGRTQQGNNNAYCQDNHLSWTNWNELSIDRNMTEFVGKLVRLRRDHPIFRRFRYSVRRPVSESGVIPDLAWLSPSGEVVQGSRWEEAEGPIGIFLNGQGIRDLDSSGKRITDDSFILYLNPVREEQQVRLPDPTYGRSWEVMIDTANEGPTGETGANYISESALRMVSNSALVLRRLS